MASAHGWGGSGTVKVKGTDVVVPPAFTGLTNQSDHNLDGRPYPTNIAITSTPSFRVDVYGEEEIIQVRVKFDQNVTVGPSASGTAGGDTQVALFIGSEADERPLLSYAKPAFYVSGSGTDTLFFEYRVEYSDRDINGVAAALPWGGNIKATGTEIFYRADLDGVLDENPDHKVDGSLRGPDTDAPTISSISITSDPGDDDTYVEDDSIEITVTFSEYVIITGTPQLELDLDGTATTADYRSTSGAAVVFSYAVAAADIDTDGIAIGADKLTLNGGSIQDGGDNNAVLTHDAVAPDPGHKVEGTDTTAPTVSSVAITSDPGDDDTYGLGDSIEVTVTFSEDVTVTGTPQLELGFRRHGEDRGLQQRQRARGGLQLHRSTGRERRRRNRHRRRQAVPQRGDHKRRGRQRRHPDPHRRGRRLRPHGGQRRRHRADRLVPVIYQ